MPVASVSPAHGRTCGFLDGTAIEDEAEVVDGVEVLLQVLLDVVRVLAHDHDRLGQEVLLARLPRGGRAW